MKLLTNLESLFQRNAAAGDRQVRWECGESSRKLFFIFIFIFIYLNNSKSQPSLSWLVPISQDRVLQREEGTDPPSLGSGTDLSDDGAQTSGRARGGIDSRQSRLESRHGVRCYFKSRQTRTAHRQAFGLIGIKALFSPVPSHCTGSLNHPERTDSPSACRSLLFSETILSPSSPSQSCGAT